MFPEDVQRIFENPRKEKLVLVFPHSSKWESFWYVVYHAATGKKACALCYYSFFNIPIIGKWLKNVGLIPVYPKAYGGPGSAVESIVTILNDTTNYPNGFVFAISPQGGINAAEWKSGYYAIARATGAQIVVFGLDYATHSVAYIDKRFKPEEYKKCVKDDDDNEEAERQLCETEIKNHITHFMPARPNAILPPPRFLKNDKIPFSTNIAWISGQLVFVSYLLFSPIESYSKLMTVILFCYLIILRLTQVEYIIERQMHLKMEFQSRYVAYRCPETVLFRTMTLVIRYWLVLLWCAIFHVISNWNGLMHAVTDLHTVVVVMIILWEWKFRGWCKSYPEYSSVQFLVHFICVLLLCPSFFIFTIFLVYPYTA